jgi:uncharacterized protein (DUF1499 family)
VTLNNEGNAMPRYGWVILGVVLFLLVAGPAVSGRLLPPLWGISTFIAGGGLGLLLGAGLGAAALYGAFRRRPWVRRATVAGIGPLLAGLLVVGLFVARPGPATRFNDVATDLRDPPVFSVGPAAGIGYPAAFLDWHRQAYPSLTSIRLPQPPDAAFEAVERAARQMDGWEVVHADRVAGMVQAVARTRLFRFEDDIVVRIRPDGGQSLIDVRSRSRIGMGDRGANAQRVEAFLARLGGR